MSDESFNQPTEHEQQVADEEEERERGGAIPTPGSQNPVTGDATRSTYEEEVEAEREGTTADELAENADDSDAPVDSAYRPRSG